MKIKTASMAKYYANAGLLTTLLSVSAHAQETPPAEDGKSSAVVEEVTVTASRREERLQDVAIAVSVVDPKEFSSGGLTELTSILPFVPGVAVQDSGGTFSSDIYIRGINATGAGGVGTYVDDIPFGSSTKDAGGGAPLDSTLLDLDNLSVLKGPQGTLYGASAMGGVLKYTTRNPSTSFWSSEVSADLSSTKGGGMNQLYRVSANGPIAQDLLGLSVTGFWKDKEGYIDNVALGKQGWDDYEYYGGSANLLFTPSEELSVKAQALYQKSTQEGMATIPASNEDGTPLFGKYAIAATSLEPSVFEAKLFGLSLDYDFGFAKLTSITSYQKFSNDRSLDLTIPFASFADAYFPENAPHSSAIITQAVGWERRTQELRLTSVSNKTFEWLVGAFYSKEEGYNAQEFTTVPAEPTFFVVDFPSKYTEKAAFVSGTYYFTPQFDVTAGYRLSDTENSIVMYAVGPLVAPVPLNVYSDKVNTYMLNARYRPTDSLSIFARAANGFRPAVANFKIADTETGEFLSDAFVKPDKLWSYELGVKGTAADGRLNYEVATFYIDWKDFQVNVLRGGILVATNGDHASSRGAEASANFAITDALSLMGAVAYTDAKLEADDPDVGGRSGEQLPNTPAWSGTLGLRYGFDVGTLPAYVSGSYRYNGEYPVGFGGVNIDGQFFPSASPRYTNDSYDIVNLQVGLTTQHFDVSAYVTNLFNEYGYSNITTNSTAPATAIPLRRRTVGVMLKTKF